MITNELRADYRDIALFKQDDYPWLFSVTDKTTGLQINFSAASKVEMSILDKFDGKVLWSQEATNGANSNNWAEGKLGFIIARADALEINKKSASYFVQVTESGLTTTTNYGLVDIKP